MKIAFVYDWINTFGGAERVLLALHEIWPEAPIFTSVYNQPTTLWANDIEIKSSFLNRLPFLRTRHRYLAPILPIAFESFDFSDFDIVLSITSSSGKSIVTNSKTKHICYCLTPTRYLWSDKNNYEQGSFSGKILKSIAPLLREQDYISAQRVDHFIAISEEVSHRISKYYQRESVVIYPPVDTQVNIQPQEIQEPYYLVVSRLVPYKRIDLAIEACKNLKRKLIIIGTGPQEDELKSLANSSINFLGHLTDEQVSYYYNNSRALLFPGFEDFGISPLEAGAHGKAVIAYNKGGVAETICDQKTGVLFQDQSVDCLQSAIISFEEKELQFKSQVCIENAKRFDKQIFQTQIKKYIKAHL